VASSRTARKRSRSCASCRRSMMLCMSRASMGSPTSVSYRYDVQTCANRVRPGSPSRP
jgi:hypothetical protein